MSSEGMGIGRFEEKVVFVEQSVPGDNVDAFAYKNRSKFMQARLEKLNLASDMRIEPFCAHFGLCGGCKWQYLSYKDQLAFKQQIVEDAFSRIGKVDIGEVLPIMGAPADRSYRNKLEFTFSNKRWLTQEQIDSEEDFERNGLGFHIKGYFDKVVDVEQCHLQDSLQNEIRNFIRPRALEKGITFYDIRERRGNLRNLILRNNRRGEWMLILAIWELDEDIKSLLEEVKEQFPQISSLQYVINQKANDTISDLDCVVFHGSDHLIETLGEYRFKIGPKSFFQTNTEQAERLYGKAIEFAGLKGGETLYDLYTGVGSIGIYMSNGCEKVVGLEYVPEAIEDAKENARLNDINHCHFYAGDVKDLLGPELFEKHGKADVLVVDPPRAGMHGDVVESILEAEPPKVVYISCNPSTQARDIALMDAKYRVEKIQPVDMFPQTTHIENIALLTLR